MKKSVHNNNNNNNNSNNKKSIEKFILLLIIFFVLYNLFIVNSHSSKDSIKDSSKEDALKRVKDYVIQLEQDVSKFQTIIENKIKPQNNLFDNNNNNNNNVNDYDIGKKLRGIIKSIGLDVVMKSSNIDTKKTKDKDKGIDISKKTSINWSSRISNLFNKFATNTIPDNKKLKINNIDNGIDDWLEQIKRKLNCLYGGKGAIYLYHMRKAAGSSIKDILDFATKRWRVRYMFTEGRTLDEKLLNPPGIFKVLSFREPVARIISLYWYEHVSWYAAVKKEPKKIFSFIEWFDAWCDGSEWKNTFITKNPGNVYVEVENYYTKSLSGWQGPEPISRKHLDIAKKNLEKFDLILIQEWMADISQVDAMTELFPGRLNIAAGSKVKGDKDLRKRYEQKYAPDMPALKEKINILNKYDIELYEYATFLAAKRSRLIPDIVEEVVNNLVPASNSECSILMDRSLNFKMGLFQPFGHKGPFKPDSVDD